MGGEAGLDRVDDGLADLADLPVGQRPVPRLQPDPVREGAVAGPHAVAPVGVEQPHPAEQVAGGPLDALAQEHGATPSQLALAWLLRRSPVMLPIPGTSTVAHLEDNLAAASLQLSDDEFARLTDAVR